MKFALVNGKKIEATKGAQGKCPYCESELIAKCGTCKTPHWAHKAIRNCDPWWENETEWHRSWKNKFLEDWQEKLLFDEETSEKHIADVRTDKGLVIEFQHSFINPNERIAREKFYKKMVWVADGTRLKKDYNRFLKGLVIFRSTKHPKIFHINPLELDEYFPRSWVGSSAPVIFDFKGYDSIDDSEKSKTYLYCLLPKKIDGSGLLLILSRQYFIDKTTSGDWLSIMEAFRKPIQKQNQQQQKSSVVQNFSVRRESEYIFHKGRYIKRRRF
jgi:competence protein CoiA